MSDPKYTMVLPDGERIAVGPAAFVAYGEAKRPRGRPHLDDKRSPRGGFNDAEWAKVKAKAEAEGITAAAWVRARCGL